jgi:hypothetical protein
VVAIPKANSAERILENCGASDWRLSAEQIIQLDSGIQFRHRNKFDKLLRKLVPNSLHTVAVRARNMLPKRIRRLIT